MQIGQTIWDLALQKYGTAEAVAWLVYDNPRALWAAGEIVNLRSTRLDSHVAEKFRNKTIKSQ